jgi:hypothetical protein
MLHVKNAYLLHTVLKLKQQNPAIVIQDSELNLSHSFILRFIL